MKKTLDKVLIIVGSFIAAFIIATVIIYTIKDWPYDTLIPCVVGGGVLEAINTMIITVSKIRGGKDVTDDIGDSDLCSDSECLGDNISLDGK
jgi:hypothetical protein